LNIIAYSYSDPMWESPPDPAIWGWEINRVYQDLDYRRPQLQQLVRDCQHEPVAYLLLRRFEELGESVAQVSDCLAQLKALDVHVFSLEEGEGTQGDRPDFTLEMLQSVQAQQRSRQIRRGHARKRLKALPPPGKTAYGYRHGKDRYVIDRAAAAIVKDFFEHFLLYGSLRGSVRYLEKKHGKQISVATGRRWLTHPVYRGDLVYRNQQILRDTHPAIIDREEAAQVDRLLRRNRSLPARSASAPRSLAGLVVCADCQSSMNIARVTAPRRAQEYLYLRPTDCAAQPKCRAIPYAEVLNQTIEQICQELPSAIAAVNLPMMGQIQTGLTSAIAAKAEVIEQLPDLIANGILDSETAALRTYQLRTEIAALESQLAQLPPPNLRQIAQTISIPQFWHDLSEAERRFYFREFLNRIEVVRSPDWSLKLVFIF
jgi:DNA invertase Pin-like site-specific DNA recombinase